MFGSLGCAKFHTLQPLDKVDVSRSLIAQPFSDVRVRECTLFGEQAANPWQKDAFGIEEGIAISKNHLELFHGPERAPHARSQADKTDGPLLETLRELQHVDEILQYAWHASVVFGCDDDEPLRLENTIRKRSEGPGLLAVGRRRKDFRRQLGEVEDL